MCPIRQPSPWRRAPVAPPAVLAHRGGVGPWRENTLAAFAGALAAGADGVELDVRRTLDGALVVHHDPDVPGVGPVARCRAGELPSWVPSLDEALDACGAHAVDVEVKNLPTEPDYDPGEAVAGALGALLARRRAAGRASGKTVVSSFWPETLAALAAEADPPDLALLVHPALDAAHAAEQATALGCVALNPHHTQVTAALVARCHDLGLAVMAWTVDTAHLPAVAAAGVDAVITDEVGPTLTGLGRR